MTDLARNPKGLPNRTVFVALKWGFQAAMLIGCLAYVLAGLASRSALSIEEMPERKVSVL